jgi:hypothetical protein
MIRIFKDFSKSIGEFLSRSIVPAINEVSTLGKKLDKRVVLALKQNKWFVLDSMPLDFISEIVHFPKGNGTLESELNEHFINYFSKNNWVNFEDLYLDWVEIPHLKKRKKILSDIVRSIKILSKEKSVNTVNIILPILVNQIDGVIDDLLEANGYVYISKTNEKGKTYSYWAENNEGNQLSRIKILEKIISQNVYFEMERKVIPLLIEDLYQGSTPRIALKKSKTFNRNKLAHGELLNYGTKVNLIRAIMIFDYLTGLLKNPIKLHSGDGSVTNLY